MCPIALKRTEFKRATTQRNKKRNTRRKERYDAKKLTQLTKFTQYQTACAEVDRRDRNQCQECGETYGVEHHHAILRSAGGKDDAENLVLLCGWCHRSDPEAPHQSSAGRIKWVEHLTKLYPTYWKNSRKSQEITQRYNNRTAIEQQEVAK